MNTDIDIAPIMEESQKRSPVRLQSTRPETQSFGVAVTSPKLPRPSGGPGIIHSPITVQQHDQPAPVKLQQSVTMATDYQPQMQQSRTVNVSFDPNHVPRTASTQHLRYETLLDDPATNANSLVDFTRARADTNHSSTSTETLQSSNSQPNLMNRVAYAGSRSGNTTAETTFDIGELLLRYRLFDFYVTEHSIKHCLPNFLIESAYFNPMFQCRTLLLDD